MIDKIIEFNKQFVASKSYEQYITDKYPDKRLAVLSCMDTRLTDDLCLRFSHPEPYRCGL